jgi:Ala-tRNA(Pro) deacylase
MYHPLRQTIVDLLTAHSVWFETFEHAPVRTSKEAAVVRPEYTLSQGAKALVVRVKQGGSKSFIQVVVPGDTTFDVKKLKQLFGFSDVRFATIDEVSAITHGVQPGGVPPFGNLFNLPVYVDDSLFLNEKIIFNAGDRAFSIGMCTKDYATIVKPYRGSFVSV